MLATTRQAIQKEISQLTNKIAKEGKTDAIEDRLDAVEARIGKIGNQVVRKELKDQLGTIK